MSNPRQVPDEQGPFGEPSESRPSLDAPASTVRPSQAGDVSAAQTGSSHQLPGLHPRQQTGESAPAFTSPFALRSDHPSREGSAESSQLPFVPTSTLKERRALAAQRNLTLNIPGPNNQDRRPSMLGAALSPRTNKPASATKGILQTPSSGGSKLSVPSPARVRVTPGNERSGSSLSFHFDKVESAQRPSPARLLSQGTPSPSQPLASSKLFHLPFSPTSGSKSSSKSSGKTAVSSVGYGVNPNFNLGGSSPGKISGKSQSPGASPPKSPWTPRTPHRAFAGFPSTPRLPHTPRTPRTPMTARSQKASPNSYQGMMLTTVTTRDGAGAGAGTSAEATAQGTVGTPLREKRGSLTTDLLHFVRGGAEIVPRLELTVLEAPKRPQNLNQRALSYSNYDTLDKQDEVEEKTEKPARLHGRSRSQSLSFPLKMEKEDSDILFSPITRQDPKMKRASIHATGLNVKRLSYADRRVSFAPPSVPVDEAGEGANDLAGDARRPSAMRRPSYAASVFQQSKLMDRKPSMYPTETVATGVTEEDESEGDAALQPPASASGGRRPSTPGQPQLAPIEESEQEEAQSAVKAKTRPRWLQFFLDIVLAPYRFLKWQIDPVFLWSIINPKDFLWPITVRKVLLYTLYGGIIAGLVLLDHYFHWWAGLSRALHGKNLAIMGVLYGFEPFMVAIIMMVAKVPDSRQVPDRTVLLPRGHDSETTSINTDYSGSTEAEGEEHHQQGQEQEQEQQQQQYQQQKQEEREEFEVRRSLQAETTMPMTPMFNPRARRATIILHEPVDLSAHGGRRPSAQSMAQSIAQSVRHQYQGPPAAEQSNRGAIGAGHLPESPDTVVVPLGGMSHPSLTETTALVIPCHNADAEVLKAVLFAALVHFEPWQIFIVDNSNSEGPTSNLEDEIRSQPMFKRINYVWLPVGNKNIAQFVGASAAAKLGLDYVLTIDDDVIIPANFACPMHLISETVTAVCYPITAVDTNGDRPLFVGWQDIEYKMSALAKMAESRLCGVLYPHGAASFWKRDTLIQVLRRHDLIYFADDVKMGIELQALGQLMSIDASISFETVAPETFLGPSRQGAANYYIQRVRSWEMARHTLYWQFSKRFLFSLNGAKTPTAIFWQKFTQFYVSTGNFIDWIRLPVFIILGGSSQFWIRSIGLILGLPILPLIPYRFWKTRRRPDLHPHMLDMLTYGVYKLMFSFVCILGALRTMWVFFPNHKPKPNLIQMEKNNDPRCIWLREDFMAYAAARSQAIQEQEPEIVISSPVEEMPVTVAPEMSEIATVPQLLTQNA